MIEGHLHVENDPSKNISRNIRPTGAGSTSANVLTPLFLDGFMRLLPPRQDIASRYEPCPRLPAQVLPGPVQEHEEAIPISDEVNKMDEEPSRPGQET